MLYYRYAELLKTEGPIINIIQQSRQDLKKQCIHLKKLRCKHNMFDCSRNIQKLSIACAEYEHGVELGMPGAEQALATLTAKVALWTKWADCWQKLANYFGLKE